eukprot:scaffold1541_cov256-Pinguiococcus_pyrenoidosus.AAC.13
MSRWARCLSMSWSELMESIDWVSASHASMNLKGRSASCTSSSTTFASMCSLRSSEPVGRSSIATDGLRVDDHPGDAVRVRMLGCCFRTLRRRALRLRNRPFVFDDANDRSCSVDID